MAATKNSLGLKMACRAGSLERVLCVAHVYGKTRETQSTANTCAHELEFIARNNRHKKQNAIESSYAAACAMADAVENEIAKEAIRRREHPFFMFLLKTKDLVASFRNFSHPRPRPSFASDISKLDESLFAIKDFHTKFAAKLCSHASLYGLQEGTG